MLDVIDLDFDYPDKSVLRGVHFSLSAGGLLHLRGSNGSGKTTLLKLLAGLLEPASGDIRYCGESIANNRALYQQGLCYVGHKTGISPILTVRENCKFEWHANRHAASLDAWLEQCSLSGVADVPCGLLSMGQRRRVGLLRLLMSDASLWLLDEPLVALDQDAVAFLMTCLTTHLHQGGQIILTSHQRLPRALGDYQAYCL